MFGYRKRSLLNGLLRTGPDTSERETTNTPTDITTEGRNLGIPWAVTLAIEHGLILCSTDSDFAKYKDITWENPLE